MKNILKTTFLFLLVIASLSCETERDTIAVANGFKLKNDNSNINSPILLSINDDETYALLKWDISDNGYSSISTYTIVISDKNSDPTFKDEVEYTGIGIVVSPTERLCKIKVKEFNDLMNKLPTFKCSEMNINVRVKSKLGTGKSTFYQYSNPITLAVTAYSTKAQIIAFTKEGNSVSETTPKIYSSNADNLTDFQGYMYLEPGNYKFYRSDACNSFTSPTIYGSSTGNLTGNIDQNTSASSISIITAGHYFVTLNADNLTYTIKNFRAFGVFGPATRAAVITGNAVPMTYDATKNVWKITMDLIKGKKFKFKSNLWIGDLITPPADALFPKPDFIPPGSTTSTISTLGVKSGLILEDNAISSGGLITVPGTTETNETQKYEITLDISKPRNYSYTLTLK